MKAGAPRLTRPALTLLLRAAGHPKALLNAALAEDFPEIGELITNRWLVPSGNRTGYVEVDGRDYELEWDSERKAYRYFSPAAGWVTVPPDQLKSCKVHFEQLMSAIRQWLDMPERTPPESLLPELLWELGEIWIGRRRMAVLFLRRAGLPETLSRVRTALLEYPRRGSCLILTDTNSSRHGPALPGDPILLPLPDLFSPNRDVLDKADMETLAAFVGMPAQSKKEWTPVECSEDGGYLRIHERKYRFIGHTHKRIVRILYEAWERGEPRLRTAKVLVEVEAGSTVRTMSHVFSGCKEDWKSAIGYGGGYCWLMV
ncbi:MAG: hypothetical protein D6720_06020 [Gammaproteobacteria bacterium]|nr:MAG: hypothetical protein D6720_06020 [Gammaproteobacteria bacterium]